MCDRDKSVMRQAMRRANAQARPNPQSKWTCQPKRRMNMNSVGGPQMLYIQVDSRTFGNSMDSACVNFKNSPMCLSAVDVARARQRKQQYMKDM